MSVIGQQLIDAVKDAAAESPDFVYNKEHRDKGWMAPCEYVRGGQPSCIVGKAAWNLGLIDDSFESEDENSAGVYGLLLALDLLGAVSEAEIAWLSDAQNAQDAGTPWGKVPDEADSSSALYAESF